MNDEIHKYLSTLNKKTLVEIIDSLSFAAGFEIHHGDDPSDEGHAVYGVHCQDGSFTLAHIDQSSFEETMSKKIDNGCGCCNDPPCIGCAPPSASPPVADAVEPNRLHLFSVYTIDSDLTESDPVYVMARHEAGAACLFHKARARDHDNIICEVIVSKVQDAEVCDE